MIVLGLFDGHSGGQFAFDDLGITFDGEKDIYFASEIDKYAMAVTQYRYPNTIQIGDITKVRYEKGVLYSENGQWEVDIDMVIGGSPCTGFSMAGKGLNFDDPRSKLFFDFTRLIDEVKPTYFMLENVKMKKEWLDTITEYMGVEPVFINSRLVSAQNRQRYYWTNIPNVTIPEDSNITWGDIRETGVNAQNFYYTEKAMQWLGRHSQRKNKTLTVHNNDDKMQMIEASHYKKYSSQRFFGVVDLPEDTQTVAAMRGRYLVNGKRKDGNTAGKTQQYIEFRYDGKTNAITTVQKDNVIVPFTLPNRVPVTDFFFRYITPLECERCQTVPDNATLWGNFNGVVKQISNSQRYKMLGNGWTMKVISHIFSFIPE